MICALAKQISVKEVSKPKDWAAQITDLVKRLMTGWKMPNFIRNCVEEQLSKSIISSMSKEGEESFEKILSESLQQVQYEHCSVDESRLQVSTVISD